MAQSPTHRFGQIIGDLLEAAVRPVLASVATKHNLYLDCKGDRACRGRRQKVCWTDRHGNSHDLDYVLEAGGSAEQIGRPRAFIEIAYRRYTKHSRNKAQEIQGAILPLAETYREDHPFLGTVLGGVFTEGSLTQLRSHGFGILYFPFESIVAAFKTVKIDAYFDESSTDAAVQRKVNAFQRLSLKQRTRIADALLKRHAREVDQFIRELKLSITRAITLILVLALHGTRREAKSVGEAIEIIEQYGEDDGAAEFVRYEIDVRYSNGDEIRGTFASKAEAIKFLNGQV